MVIPTLSRVDGWEWSDEQCLCLVTWGFWIEGDSSKVNGALNSDRCVKFYEVIIFFLVWIINSLWLGTKYLRAMLRMGFWCLRVNSLVLMKDPKWILIVTTAAK